MSIGIAIAIDLHELLATQGTIESFLLPPDRAALDAVGSELETQTRRRFEEKSSPSGEAWAPWSVPYAASGRGRELLVREGHLRDSIQSLTRDDEVEVGSNLEYARRQNSGFTGRDARGRNVTQPARQFLGLSEYDLEAVRDIVVDHYDRKLRGLG